MGIHKLEFATDEAKDSKYFMWHTQEGVHIQTSSKKRSDVTKVESWMLDYTFVDRHLTSDDYVALVKKDNDFEQFTASVGMENCSNLNYDRYYYELENNLYLVCIVEFGKIEFVKLANEDKIISTLWIAPDRIMVEGEYRQYTPIKRKTPLNEDIFKTFILRSNNLNELIKEIGLPNGEKNNVFYNYYKLSDNRFVVCEGHAVFCKTFLEKVANDFSIVLHLHFPQYCRPYFPTLSDGKIVGLQTGIAGLGS